MSNIIHQLIQDLITVAIPTCFFFITTFSIGHIFDRLIIKTQEFTTKRVIINIFLGISITLILISSLALLLPTSKIVLILLPVWIISIVYTVKIEGFKLLKTILIPFLLLIIITILLLITSKGLNYFAPTNNDSFYYIPISDYAKRFPVPLLVTENQITDMNIYLSLPNTIYPYIRIGNILLDSIYSYSTFTSSIDYYFISKCLGIALLLLAFFYIISDLKSRIIQTLTLILAILSYNLVLTWVEDFMAFIWGFSFLILIINLLSEYFNGTKNNLSLYAIIISGFVSLYCDLTFLVALIVMLSMFSKLFLEKRKEYLFITLKDICKILILSIIINPVSYIRFLLLFNLQFKLISVTSNPKFSDFFSYFTRSFGITSEVNLNNIIELLLVLLTILGLIIYLLYRLKKYKSVSVPVISVFSTLVVLVQTINNGYDYGINRSITILGSLIILVSIYFLINHKNSLFTLILAIIILILNLQSIVISFPFIFRGTIKNSSTYRNFYEFISKQNDIVRIRLVGNDFPNQLINYEHLAAYYSYNIIKADLSLFSNEYSYFNNESVDIFKYHNYPFSHIISNYKSENLFNGFPIISKVKIPDEDNLYFYEFNTYAIIPRGSTFYPVDFSSEPIFKFSGSSIIDYYCTDKNVTSDIFINVRNSNVSDVKLEVTSFGAVPVSAILPSKSETEVQLTLTCNNYHEIELTSERDKELLLEQTVRVSN